uniref:Kinetochore scaffold 1 n=1 Tax=Elaeophora elaphi TaxID=1147741 RepID=A0A0R3RG67_9BILA
MEKKDKERRSSILKPHQPPNVDNGELSTTVTATVKRRVSFHTVRTVQEFDVEHSKIMHSPHNEPMKLYDTTSSDGLTLEQVSASESNDGYAAEINANKLNHTVENFMPVTTSTPLLRLRDPNDLSDCAEICHPTKSHNCTRKEKTNDVLEHISEETIQNEDVLEVESMDMSNSNHYSPVTIDSTRKLFRRSTVLRHFTNNQYQQSGKCDETLASNATRMIFKAGESDGCQSGVSDDEEFSKMAAERTIAVLSNVDIDDMDISSGDGQLLEIPIDASFKQLTVDGTDEPTNILFRTIGKDAETLNHEVDSKSIVMFDDIQISNYVSSNVDSMAAEVNVTHDISMNSVHNIDQVAHSADDVALEISSQLDRQHISNEFHLSVRKAELQSPAALPRKKLRLFSPEATLPPKPSSLLCGSPRIGSSKDKTNPINTSENTTSIDKSTDKVLTEIKHRLRRSLNQSGVFTLSELSAASADNINMLYDIPVPEPLLHLDELNSQVSTAESFNTEIHTAAEQSYVESSSLSSRRSEIVTAALGNESSFLTSRVDTVGFNINFRTIPCLRIKPNEQPQIVELKQLATTNLRKRIAEVVDRCKGLISTELPNCSNRKIAECIRTLNPRKLSRKEANWFDVCYLMAQREWFVLRAKLAKLTGEKLDELLFETKTESDQKKRLAESVKDCQRSRDEVMQRYAQLKLLDEAVDSEVQNEMELDKLIQAKRGGRLEIVQKELELTEKQGAHIKVLLKEYDKTKSAMEILMAKKTAQREEFLRKYDEDIDTYRELLTEKQ